MGNIIPLKELSERQINRLKNIYLSSFPEDERRPWNMLLSMAVNPGHPLTLFTIADEGGEAIGLITMWRFDCFVYIEHFAIDERYRGRGLGGKVLTETKLSTQLPIVLEVEPVGGNYGATAQRRVDFYRRYGFTDFPDFEYIQPPYIDSQRSVKLMLMSTDRKIDLNKVSTILRKEVYGVDAGKQ